MKKILLLTFFMFVLQMFVFSNDFNFNNTYFFPTDELVNSPQLQLLQINNRLKIIQYNIDKLYWRPNVSLSLDPSFNMSGLDSYSLGLSNSISLSQKLPMKTNLSLSVSQPLSFKLPNGDNSYRFSFSTNLNISTSLFNKEIRNNFSNIEKKYLDNLFQEVTLKYAISKMEFEENILTIVGMYLYYKTLINIYSERKGLLEKKSQDDFLLYSEGHITSVEYAERENVKMQNAANFLKYYEQMFYMRLN